MACGFDRARGTLTVTLDADLQNDPADIPRSGAPRCRGVRRGLRLAARSAGQLAAAGLQPHRQRGAQPAERRDRIATPAARSRLPDGVPAPDQDVQGDARFLPTLLKMEGARVIECGQPPAAPGWKASMACGPGLPELPRPPAVRWMKSRQIDYRRRSCRWTRTVPGVDGRPRNSRGAAETSAVRFDVSLRRRSLRARCTCAAGRGDWSWPACSIFRARRRAPRSRPGGHAADRLIRLKPPAGTSSSPSRWSRPRPCRRSCRSAGDRSEMTAADGWRGAAGAARAGTWFTSLHRDGAHPGARDSQR